MWANHVSKTLVLVPFSCGQNHSVRPVGNVRVCVAFPCGILRRKKKAQVCARPGTKGLHAPVALTDLAVIQCWAGVARFSP